MKARLRFGVSTMLLLASSVVSADILLYTPNADTCASLPGAWSGTGKVYQWSIGTCLYHGKATIQSVDATGHFILDIAVEKDSGSLLCPNHYETRLPGSCVDGQLALTTKYGHLTGALSGDTGHAEGTLTISPGINAQVNIQLQKMSS